MATSIAVTNANDLIQRGQGMQALHLLDVAATGGDGEAAFEHAIHQLVGNVTPRNLPGARARLRTATSLGHSDAALMEIALTASGAGAPPDWSAALQLLKAAAVADITAREHLDLLQSMKLAENGYPNREFALERLSTVPMVSIIRAFLTRDECRHIALAAEPIIEPSTVWDPGSGRLIAHPIRTSHGAPIGPTRETLPIQAVLRRIAAATNTDVFAGEPLNVLRYAPGQQYRPHIDAASHLTNQRHLTVLLYLNEGYSGGETEFLHNGLKVRAQIGDAVVFRNTTADGRPDPSSQHAGLPVRQGVKWLATRWIRERPFDPWTT